MTIPAILPTEPMRTADDVRRWFDALHAADISFHPEDGFDDIVVLATRKPLFSPQGIAKMNAAMDAVYVLSRSQGFDPCEIACDSDDAARGI